MGDKDYDGQGRNPEIPKTTYCYRKYKYINISPTKKFENHVNNNKTLVYFSILASKNFYLFNSTQRASAANEMELLDQRTT